MICLIAYLKRKLIRRKNNEKYNRSIDTVPLPTVQREL